jgi:hypothetical protein
LLTSLRVRSAIVLGVALLMSLKPSGLASLVIIVLAVVIGLLAGQLSKRPAGTTSDGATGELTY